jgi:hypothetical protein
MERQADPNHQISPVLLPTTPYQGKKFATRRQPLTIVMVVERAAFFLCGLLFRD